MKTLLLGLAWLMFVGVSAQCDGNLSTNGGFSAIVGEGHTAPGWLGSSTPDVNNAQDSLHTTGGYYWLGTPLPSNSGGTWQNVFDAEEIWQSVNVLPGQCYELRFEYASQPIGSDQFTHNGPVGVKVNINGLNVYTTPNDTSPYTWESASYAFTVTSATQLVIKFSATTGNYVGIDGVCLVPLQKSVNLGPDTVICAGSTLVLAPSSFNVTSFLWQDGSTDNTYTVTLPGTYIVQATGGCLSSDTIQVGSLTPIVFSLGPDTIICPGTTITLQTGVSNANWVWQNGAKGTSYAVTSPGLYFVQANTPCGVVNDSVLVNSGTGTLQLGADTFLCPGSGITLTPFTTYAAYTWQNGSTASSFQVTQPGNYSVAVNTPCGVLTDSVIVTAFNDTLLNLGNDVVLCNQPIVVLNAAVPLAQYYNWSDGSHEPNLVTTNAGLYSVAVGTPCGVLRDTVKLLDGNCACKLYIPNAFTPNGDGNNDVFMPYSDCLPVFYELTVYNRWGEKMFTTQNFNAAWDGTYKQTAAMPGVYVYTVIYRFEQDIAQKLKGSLTLVR